MNISILSLESIARIDPSPFFILSTVIPLIKHAKIEPAAFNKL